MSDLSRVAAAFEVDMTLDPAVDAAPSRRHPLGRAQHINVTVKAESIGVARGAAEAEYVGYFAEAVRPATGRSSVGRPAVRRPRGQ